MFEMNVKFKNFAQKRQVTHLNCANVQMTQYRQNSPPSGSIAKEKYDAKTELSNAY
jgi:hypothetical protein